MDNISKNTDNYISSPEYLSYQYLKHWAKADDLEQLRADIYQDTPLFSCAFKLVEELYSKLPLRRDRRPSMIHPFNVVLALKDAKIDDEIVLTVGLLHDYVEEMVDLYKEENNIRGKNAVSFLDDYELKVLDRLEQQLSQFGNSKLVIEAVKLLTRHKRDFYYRSISTIFQCPDEKLKEIAIRVKLADRMHNVLSIEYFHEEERLYQCFKNIFILNNAKRFLLEDPERIAKDRNLKPTELLFKRCAKATFDAFLAICRLALVEGINKQSSMLQLAFKKFAMEKAGIRQVTNIDETETHLIRLYQGVIRKYDARLHHEWEKYDQMRGNEFDFCRKFFADYNFDDEQIKALIDYKDAFSLKEIIADLLYLPNYTIGLFLSSELDSDARIYDY